MLPFFCVKSLVFVISEIRIGLVREKILAAHVAFAGSFYSKHSIKIFG